MVEFPGSAMAGTPEHSTKGHTMSLSPEGSAAPSKEPFPLKRRFLRGFVPAFFCFIVVLLILTGTTALRVTESIYLELAQHRAQSLSRAVADRVPAAWKSLMSGQTLAELQDDSTALAEAFNSEVRNLNLSELKVYDLDRRVLFATHAEEIGTRESGAALLAVIRNAAPEIASKNLPDGARQYELYVPVFDDAGELRAVFELYEPVGYLDAILAKAAIPVVAMPGLLLIVLIAALGMLVSRAQSHIDSRTDALNALRRRIETFVSNSAADAARTADAGGAIRSRKIDTTLFFSDIRSFTSFAEQNPPEDVVAFLNNLMTLQVRTIAEHGGDVDKMIGDAVLGRFDGDDGAARALAAARDILAAVRDGHYPRGIGIGVYRGEVISGAVGPEDRRDFTVIGDAVNIAARLCSEAGLGQLVTDAALADDAFGPTEEIRVKGRQEPLTIRRQTL